MSAGREGAVHLAAAALVAAAIGVHAWAGWHQVQPAVQPANMADYGGTGSLVAVTLGSGATFYGTLAQVSQGFIKLQGVYYVQNMLNPASKQQENQVVNREKNDWHGPQWMLIERDKIAFVESIGPASRLRQLIEQEKKLTAAQEAPK